MNSDLQNEIASLLNAQEFNKALKICEAKKQDNPNWAEPYQLIALINFQQKNIARALNAMLHAIYLEPENPVLHNNISNIYKALHNPHMVQKHLLEAIRLKPNYATAYNNLGSLLYRQHQLEDAAEHFATAIRLQPNYFAAHLNLANTFFRLNKTLEAISHYEKALEIKPQHLETIQNLSIAYILVRDFTKALPLLEHAVNQLPEHAELTIQLAEIYLELGESANAMTYFNKAANLNPNRAEVFHNLGVLYLRDNNHNQALENFAKTLQLNPNNATAQHMFAALSNSNSKFNANYTSKLFDQYAPFYNKHLRETLKYSLPEQLRNLLSKHLSSKIKSKNILELGCGTGLASPFFRDLATQLVGIDLSIPMLLQAKQLQAYDLLCHGNITSTVPGLNQAYFDLVIAADVFVYLDELDAVFQNVFSALKPNGIFLFSTESLNSTTLNYQLQTTGRYAHAQQYIKTLATNYNFFVHNTKEAVIRKNNNKDIIGDLYLLSC